MIPLSSQSDRIFFPLQRQMEIFGGRLTQSNDQTKLLLAGVKQNAAFSSTGCSILTDPIVNWFDKEHVGFTSNIVFPDDFV